MPAIEKGKIKKFKKLGFCFKIVVQTPAFFVLGLDHTGIMLYPHNVYYNCPSRIDSYGQGKHVYILKVHCLDMHICLRT